MNSHNEGYVVGNDDESDFSDVEVPHQQEQQTAQVDDIDRVYKILLVGKDGVGKSSLVERYTEGHKGTSLWGMNDMAIYWKKKVVLDDGGTATLYVMDWTGTSEDMPACIYQWAHGIMMVFDLTQKETLTYIDKFMTQQIKRFANKNIVKLMVGNKCHRADGKQFIDLKCAKIHAYKHQLKYIETSARCYVNIDESFKLMANLISSSSSSSASSNFSNS
ncbi:hypothetical protein SAMD00019534_012420 [Acytostelium subglobosum LB1]|uniref:hypothetical protein n=1 Tax=Acytostelium subglobosum LB1 TaxID=1410327 RepID=UPI0006449448|nr:hypothetical protein SAMD00019534_012420 [Acytostelium subglobosum LB1]GAM18067.1 hypothetical protein SAMD00019534_012420 [Acytostelium subglobosum LB1]|eukprot:XP_012758663.1 hypothetical protein SAMD00019534_012420 [Acytostelium subglobosum LB1]